MSSPRIGYQYVVLRCVPRVDREEFLNVGVVVYSQQVDFLKAASHVDPDRLAALAPDLDVESVNEALNAIEAVCEGQPSAGAPGRATLSARFGFIAAPRSTVVQPGPIHGGLTIDLSAEVVTLVDHLVAPPAASTG
jgi:hypothetical protein